MKKKFVSNSQESVRMFKSDLFEALSKVHFLVPVIVFVPVYFIAFTGISLQPNYPHSFSLVCSSHRCLYGPSLSTSCTVLYSTMRHQINLGHNACILSSMAFIMIIQATQNV